MRTAFVDVPEGYRNFSLQKNMIQRDLAAQIISRARFAIGELDTIVSEIRGNCSDEDFELIRRGAGLSIGKIITDILEPVYQQHPELDDRR